MMYAYVDMARDVVLVIKLLQYVVSRVRLLLQYGGYPSSRITYKNLCPSHGHS
jgi:hypothetical protein